MNETKEHKNKTPRKKGKRKRERKKGRKREKKNLTWSLGFFFFFFLVLVLISVKSGLFLWPWANVVVALRVEVALHDILLVVPIVCACPTAWGIGNPEAFSNGQAHLLRRHQRPPVRSSQHHLRRGPLQGAEAIKERTGPGLSDGVQDGA